MRSWPHPSMHRALPLRFVLRFGVALTGLLTAGLEQPVLAQADLRERTVFASAVDGNGEPVPDLGASDFIVREDGVRREVLRVSRALEPIDIALLVDNSAAASEAIPHIRTGLTRFIAKMAPQNQIAIIGLASRPTILTDYTSDSKRLGDGVGRLFAMSDSGMVLLDAVVETARGLERRESTRAVVVAVLTDGVEFSTRSARSVLESLTTAGAALHAVASGTFPITGDSERRERALLLDSGARRSGGQRIALLTDLAIPSALEKLARELSSQYRVVYSRPESLVPPEKVEFAASKPGVTVRATPLRVRGGA